MQESHTFGHPLDREGIDCDARDCESGNAQLGDRSLCGVPIQRVVATLATDEPLKFTFDGHGFYRAQGHTLRIVDATDDCLLCYTRAVRHAAWMRADPATGEPLLLAPPVSEEVQTILNAIVP